MFVIRNLETQLMFIGIIPAGKHSLWSECSPHVYATVEDAEHGLERLLAHANLQRELLGKERLSTVPNGIVIQRMLLVSETACKEYHDMLLSLIDGEEEDALGAQLNPLAALFQ